MLAPLYFPPQKNVWVAQNCQDQRAIVQRQNNNNKKLFLDLLYIIKTLEYVPNTKAMQAADSDIQGKCLNV